jgi:magnesium chelatase subunit H
LTVYGYWNEGGKGNVVSMLLYICNEFFADAGSPAAAVSVTPPTGCLHPDYTGYFKSPGEYIAWYRLNGRLRNTDAPTAAILLYRKHVITGQMYVNQLISLMEDEGVIPVPIFINGVEAHTVVRDQLTSKREMAAIKSGRLAWPSGLARDAPEVRILNCNYSYQSLSPCCSQ